MAVALGGAGEVDVQAAAGGADVAVRVLEQPGAVEPAEGGVPVPGGAVDVDVQDVGAGGAGGDGHVQAGVAAEPAGDLLLVGGGVLVAVPGGGDLLAWQAGEDRPAAAGVGQGLAQGGIVGHGMLRGRVWPQRVVSVASWAARAGRMRAWYSAWADSSAWSRPGWRYRTDHRPRGDVQGVQAQVVGGPARAEGGGQVAVAGPVDLVHPGAQPGDRLLPVVRGELPPARGRAGLVAAGVVRGRVGAGAGGQAGEQPGQGGVVGGFAGIEPGDLLALGGELVQGGGDLVVGHVRLQGRPVPSPGISPAGTGSGMNAAPARAARPGRGPGGGRGGRRGCARRGAAGR